MYNPVTPHKAVTGRDHDESMATSSCRVKPTADNEKRHVAHQRILGRFESMSTVSTGSWMNGRGQGSLILARVQALPNAHMRTSPLPICRHEVTAQSPSSDGEAETCQVRIRAVFDLSFRDHVPFDEPVLTSEGLYHTDCV